MKGRTLSDLWERYTRVRGRSVAEIPCPLERRRVEREAKALRDRLVVNYSPLARYVAGRIPTRATGPLDREDVLAWGLYGLLDAVETYDPARPAKFETYAISKIRWSILDELRKADPLPRSARLRMQRTERVKSELTQRYGRAPTESETANALGVFITDHGAFLDRVSRSKAGSLEAGCDALEGGLHDLVADRFAADLGMAAERAEVRAMLGRAIEELGKQERVVTTFYYYEGLTLREIGGILGLTEGRISQILRAAMIRLRGSLSDAVYLLEGAPGDP